MFVKLKETFIRTFMDTFIRTFMDTFIRTFNNNDVKEVYKETFKTNAITKYIKTIRLDEELYKDPL